MDPISVGILLSELAPIMNYEQGVEGDEIQNTIIKLAVKKQAAASKGDRNKFDLLEKQQIQIAQRGLKLIREVEQVLGDE